MNPNSDYYGAFTQGRQRRFLRLISNRQLLKMHVCCMLPDGTIYASAPIIGPNTGDAHCKIGVYRAQ